MSGECMGILTLCVAASFPLGVCRDVAMDCGLVTAPAWATAEWRELAAQIVAGEVRGVPAARMAVACTLVRDVEEGRRIGAGRWNGWARSGAGDRKAVDRALTGGCEDVPRYRYVGSFRDAQYWQAVGMIGDGPFTLFLGQGGQAVVAVE